MLITTTEHIPGKELTIIGFVKGLSYKAGFDSSQAEAEQIMISNAERLKADAIIAVKYCATSGKYGEHVMAYGTAIAYN